MLQQSALSDNDSYSTTAKTAALLDGVLAVVDECDAMVERGITASEIEEFDFSPLLRAAQETPPDGAEPVEARCRQLVDSLRLLR